MESDVMARIEIPGEIRHYHAAIRNGAAVL